MDSRKDHLIAILGGLTKDRADRVLIANMITALDDKYDLSKKMPKEPGVEEIITQHRVNLGQKGALDFLPSHSFDAVQDSRLFGSPEFTAQFPNQADRLKVAQEIRRQEQRLLKADGLIIHSDADELLR